MTPDSREREPETDNLGSRREPVTMGAGRMGAGEEPVTDNLESAAPD